MASPTCHPNKPYGARGLCKVCYNKWLRNNNAAYAKSCAEYSKRIADLPASREKRKGYNLKSRYGVTTSQKAEMVRQQSGQCAVCSEVKFLVVEHNHQTKRVRGLVCHRCNILIGQIENNQHLMPNVGVYLATKGMLKKEQ